MRTISRRAYARAGLLGNPSDGYHGKTISLIVGNFYSQVTLQPAERLTIVPGPGDQLVYDSIAALVEQISDHGYYGGVRLIKAAIKRFAEFVDVQPVTEQPFSVNYTSNIPRQVGLAGSSAIVMAAIRALAEWHHVEISPHLLASLTLGAEADLGIPAGLQDRVIQAYEGVVYMDFSQQQMQTESGLDYGAYQSLDNTPLSNLYVAWLSDAGEPTEVLHNDLRQRFESGDEQVVAAMEQFADIAEEGKAAIESGQLDRLPNLIDRNFDLRQQICNLHPQHVQLVDAARSCGASAKYCGSGGAIVGTLPTKDSLESLERTLAIIGAQVIQPRIGFFQPG